MDSSATRLKLSTFGGSLSNSKLDYDGSTIEVINWEKYNPRTDSKRPSWFRMENDIATGPGFFDLDCEQKWLWVFILSLVSAKNGQPITWSNSYCTMLTKIRAEKQFQTIELFEKYVRLRVTRKVTFEVTPATNERTNVTNETNKGVALGLTQSADALPRLGRIWNENCGKLPKVKSCSTQRIRYARIRWIEKSDESYWVSVVKRIASSSFCQGQNQRGWRADFDFFIRSETHHKVLEGKYDDRDGTGKPGDINWNNVFGGKT